MSDTPAIIDGEPPVPPTLHAQTVERCRKYFVLLEVHGVKTHAMRMAGLQKGHASQLRDHEWFRWHEERAYEAFKDGLHQEILDAALGKGRWEKPTFGAIRELNRAHNKELFGTNPGNVTINFTRPIPAAQRPELDAGDVIEALGALVDEENAADDGDE